MTYFNTKHEQLKDNYLNKDKTDLDSCGNIAITIAKLLAEKNEFPEIFHIFPKIVSETNPYPLKPNVYGGVVAWSDHYVCVSSDLVYDPILSVPVPINMYEELVFSIDTHMCLALTYEDILEKIEFN